MAGIFISYRREDAAGHAGRLFDRLAQHFGRDKVFMDVAGIEPGVDFAEAIDQAVGSCDVLIVVIGKEWARTADAAGKRRLDDPNDFVRLEVTTALRRNVRVIPLLVDGAPLPLTENLPEDLQKLARRNAFELRDGRWESDTGLLVEALEKVLGRLVKPDRPAVRVEEAADRRRVRFVPMAIGAAVIAFAIAGAIIGKDKTITVSPPAPEAPVVDDCSTRDSDGDGVNDCLDTCPSTGPAKVFPNGCILPPGWARDYSIGESWDGSCGRCQISRPPVVLLDHTEP